jgi:uncharacterized protein (TIGR03437 family)
MISASIRAQNYKVYTIAGGLQPENMPGTSAVFGQTTGVAVDAAGNVFIPLELYHMIVRLDATTGMLTRVAGNGTSGYSGDNGPATSAQLYLPTAVAVDGVGNVYIADFGNYRIRKVATNGTITTVGGNGTPGYSGDNGPATSAQLYGVQAVAVDAVGDIYIADRFNHRIRKVTANGTISTVAGNGTAGYSGDNGPATSAQLRDPYGVAVDAAGNIYIADESSSVVRKVGTDGTIITVAGNGIAGYAGDNAQAATAQLNYPFGLAADALGNIYIADTENNRIRKIAANGIISTVAGNGARGYSGDNGSAISATLDEPAAVAVDAVGNLYIADESNAVVRKVANNGIISTVAGNGNNYSGDNGPATNAQLHWPAGVAVDAADNLYIADAYDNRIRKVATSGVITTVAGNGTAGYSGDSGPATSAQLDYPFGIAVDAVGDLYIADTYSHRIRKIAPNGTISTVAGNGTAGYSGDNGPAASAQLNDPYGVAVDAAGNVYVADTANNRIRKIATNGIISTVAGIGTQGYSGDSGPGISAQLYGPEAVTVDAVGNIYVADTGNNRIRKLMANGSISTVAGNGASGYSGDNGSATGAQLTRPSGVAVDATGSVYIADSGNYVIRKVASSGVISTIAGNGSFGYSGDNGPATIAQLGFLFGAAMDTAGNVFFADYLNRVRVLVPGPGIRPIQGVLNSASYTTSITPGSIAAAFGNLVLSSPSQPANLPLPTTLGGLSIQFGSDTKAPLFYVSGSQVNFQVPWELAGQTQVPVTVSVNGQSSAPGTVSIVPFSPGIFTMNGQGTGQGAILDPSYRLVDASNPATAGSTVVQIFCTGLGPVTNQPASGSPAPTSVLAKTTTTPTVMIGGVPAQVQFSGLAPGSVGEYQVNALVPATATTGNAVPVTISLGGVSSNTVTLAVQAPSGNATLQVQISGLPVGSAASVIVTSSTGFSQTISASQSLQVPPGTYNIVANPVAVGSVTYYAQSPTPITLAAGSSTTVQVTYSTAIPSTTRTLDQTAIQGLTVSAGGNTITLPAASTAAQSLTAGNVLAIGITPATPGGLLRKIISVSQTGSQITLTTAQATLADAFQQLDFKFSTALNAQNLTPTMLARGVSIHRANRTVRLSGPASVGLSDQVTCNSDSAVLVEMLNASLVSDDNGSITTSGELDICPSLEFDLNDTVLPPVINSLTATATVTGDLHVDVSGQYKASFDKKVPIATLEGDPILVDVFGVPVVLTPDITVFVGASGEATGSFYAGATQTNSFTGGITYTGGQISPVETWTHDFTIDPLGLDANLSAKVYVGETFGLKIDEILTPQLSPEAFMELDVNPLGNPWWTLSGGVDLSGDVDVSIIGIGKDFEFPDLFNESVVITQAPGPILPSDQVPVLKSVNPNAANAGSSDITVTLAGSNFVPGSAASFNKTAVSTTFVGPTQLTAVLPASLLASAGSDGISVTNPPPEAGTSQTLSFTVVSTTPQNPQPSITGLSPTSATAGSGPITLTINGSGFITTSVVSFDGVSHAASLLSGTQLTITLGATDLAAAGSFPVVVTNPAPGGGTSNSVNFTVQPSTQNPQPAITSLSPSSAPAGASPLTLIVNGSGFVAASTVTFGGVSHTAAFVSVSQLTTPLSAADLAKAGSYPVVVTNPAPGGGTSNSVSFTVSGPVSAISVSPLSVSVPIGSVQTFAATVAGGGSVTWSVREGTAGGTVTTAGIYTAPNTTGTFHVVATNSANTTQTATATVTVITAVSYSTLYSFPAAFESASLIQGRDGSFYGTTEMIAFKLDANGTFTQLAQLSSSPDAPISPLIQATDGNFYGTIAQLGFNSLGSIFKMDASGNVTTMYTFDFTYPGATDGAWPWAGLIQGRDGDFYGTTYAGGSYSCTPNGYGVPSYGPYGYGGYISGSGCGTVFKMDAAGNLTVLYAFSGQGDGSFPAAPLIQGSDGNLYGTTSAGGTYGDGTVFKMDVSGNLTVLHSFSGADGNGPVAALTQASDGNLYGTTAWAGSSCATCSPGSGGEAFRIDTAGNFSVLHVFSGVDGWLPVAPLIQGNDGSLYGTTWAGGDLTCGPYYWTDNVPYPRQPGCGTVFKMDPSGNVTILHAFAEPPSDGAAPYAGLLLGTDGRLYGTTFFGGTSVSFGTVFRLSVPGSAQPTITALSPSSAITGSSPLTLTINGSGFLPSCSATFNAIPHTVTFISANQLSIMLSASDLATTGNFPVIVTNPGGVASNAMNFTVGSGGLSLQGKSFTINGTLTMNGKSLSFEIQTLATSNTSDFVELDDDVSASSGILFEEEFNSGVSVSGNTATFTGPSVAGFYSDLNIDQGMPISITSTTLTINFTSLSTGSPATGSIKFSTSVGTEQGTFTGTLQ